jgi:hypothetical protein
LADDVKFLKRDVALINKRYAIEQNVLALRQTVSAFQWRAANQVYGRWKGSRSTTFDQLMASAAKNETQIEIIHDIEKWALELDPNSADKKPADRIMRAVSIVRKLGISIAHPHTICDFKNTDRTSPTLADMVAVAKDLRLHGALSKEDQIELMFLVHLVDQFSEPLDLDRDEMLRDR